MNDQTPAPDYAAASNYAARVLAHPDQHSTEEVAAAWVLAHPDQHSTEEVAVARVLAHPDQHRTEEVAVARVLARLLPAPTLAGQLHAGHIGMTLRGIDARGREVHAELRQVSHTSSETFINTNALDFDTLRDGCGAMDEWLFNANDQVSLNGPPDPDLDLDLDAAYSEGTSHE